METNIEPWSVGKYAKRTCLIHLGSEDQQMQGSEEVHDVLDLTRVVEANNIISHGPIQLLKVSTDGTNTLLEVEAANSTDSAQRWSATNTGPTLFSQGEDAMITLQGGSIGVAARTFDVLSVVENTSIMNNHTVITIDGEHEDQIQFDALNRAGAKSVTPDTIPVTRFFQGLADFDPFARQRDTGFIQLHVGVSSFVEELANGEEGLPENHPLLLSEHEGNTHGEKRLGLLNTLTTMIDDGIFTITVTKTPVGGGDVETYHYPLHGVGHNSTQSQPTAFDDSASGGQSLPNDAASLGQFAFVIRVQDRYGGSYLQADPLLQLLEQTSSYNFFQGWYESGRVANDIDDQDPTKLGTKYTGRFYNDNYDQDTALFDLKVGFEISTNITRIQKRLGAKNHCDYRINIPKIIGYPDHKRCLVQVLQASFFGKAGFSENDAITGGQELPAVVGVEMSSIAPQNSFTSSNGRSRTGGDPASFGQSTMIAYGILQPYGTHVQSGTGGTAESDRVNQRLSYGFTSSRGILDEGVLVSSPFGTQVRVRFVNMTTHETLATSNATEFHNIQKNPTHLVLRFLFLDDDEVPMR